MKLRMVLIAVLILLALAGCSAAPASSPTAALPTPTPAGVLSVVTSSPTPCDLPPLVVPTLPAENPGYVQLDPATGLHITGDAQVVDIATWRLEISGKVERPLSLTYDDLRCMPKIELECTLICVGFFEDIATWAGVPLSHLLELAGASPTATGLKLYSADGYVTPVSMEQARAKDNFVAYEWEGEPVPILHGFPVRAVFPALDGSYWAKWLIRIEVE